jgi:hypothetical protein
MLSIIKKIKEVKQPKQKLYLLKIPELNVYKIGLSENPRKRVKQLQTGSPYKLEIIKVITTQHPSKLEKNLHYRFSHFKIDENIYNLTGEWFNIPIQDVNKFKETCSQVENNLENLKKEGNPFV